MTEQQAMDDKDHEVEEQLPKTMVDEPVEGRRRMPRLKVDAALDLHRRLGHLHVPGNEDINCPECALSKGGRKPVAKVRGREYLSKDPLEQLNVDSYGPIRTRSRRGMKILFVAICDSSGFLFVKPLKDKMAAPDAIGEILDEIVLKEAVYEGQRIVMRVRSDNEPALRGRPWKEALQVRQVNEMHPTPYLPQQNGVVERMMRTLGEGLRAILQGVDRSMWDYAAEYFAYSWNRVPRRQYARLKWAKDLSPLDVRHARRKE